MKCEKCGSENVIVGKLSTGFAGLMFTTEKAQKTFPLTKKYSSISVSACKDCGSIFDMKLVNPERIDKDK